jgi:hypothetical protein
MRRLSFLAFLALGGLAQAQTMTYPVTRPATPIQPKGVATTKPAQPASEPGAQAPNLDAHYFMSDEYLVLLREYKPGPGWLAAYIAKLVTPATAETKQEAEFFIIDGDKKGTKVWTKFYTMTRPATVEDLKLGTVAYCLDANREADIYVGPKNREDNLKNRWFTATITDTSNLYKGFLNFGSYKAKPTALRVPVK